MKITRIVAENYKTYRSLDLDLSVTDSRPIVLVGGGNGCGKTTLFDAIYHALYGLEIKTPRQFEEYFNSGVRLEQGIEGGRMVLEISFSGIVLGQATPFRLKRLYRLSEGKVQWSVELNMNGGTYRYGVATPAAQKAETEEQVNKVIAANLPSELSNYFLFDAMKTSDLVKEEQINKLIMKNINSVMGFNKYAMLREASEALLAEKKAAKMENEKQRQEFEALQREKQTREAELRQTREEYDRALQYANDNKKSYEESKQGRNTDEQLRDRLRKQEESIRNVERRAIDYRQKMDNVMKDLELNVLFPTLAERLRKEVEQVANERKRLAEERGEEASEVQIARLAREIVEYLRGKYEGLEEVDVEEIVRCLRKKHQRGDTLSNSHPYLNDADVEVLERLISTAYSNQFIPLDDDREVLAMGMKELSGKKDLLETYKKQLSSTDFSIIATYEENERRMAELKSRIGELGKKIEQIEREITTFDYDMPMAPDPQFDMLSKLPAFFKAVEEKLLAAKRRNIEQMMKEQLNLNLVVYAGVIGRVDLSNNGGDGISFKIYHKNGNEIFLSQLNAGAKQTVMQVLLKVLYKLGDYDPPVMIDTVMGVLDKESRQVILEHYFPNLADQTILLSTDTEITTESDLKKISAFVAKAYTLHRDKEAQCTHVTKDYFGCKIND